MSLLPILERLRPMGHLFAPADSDQVAALQQALHAAGFSGLPQSYGDVLLIADGLLFNGVRFYGTRPRQRPEDRFDLPSLLSAQQALAESRPEDLQRWQILGDADDDIFAFHRDSRQAAVLDRMTLEEVETYPGFPELFRAVVAEYGA